MRAPVRTSVAVLGHLLRGLPKWPLLLGASLALVLCALPLAFPARPTPGDAALLLRTAAVLCTVAVAFALDDPAARTTAVLPFPPVVRRLLRLALALAPLAAVWAGCGLLLRLALRAAERTALPLGGLALEAASLGAATVAVAALGLRLSAGERGSQLAAPSSVLLPLALVLTPARERLFAVPLSGDWVSSRWVWLMLLAAAAGAAALLLRESPSVPRCPPRSATSVAFSGPAGPGGSGGPAGSSDPADPWGENYAPIRP